MGALLTPCSNFTPKFNIKKKMKVIKNPRHHHHSPQPIILSSFSAINEPIKKLLKNTYHAPTITKPNIIPSLARILDALDNSISKLLDPPIPYPVDPTHVLAENNMPVDELPPTPCTVVSGGALPACLDGAYIRIGPNPQFFPTVPYCVLDGDGMLHSIRISGGRATFCSRYVRTHKYEVERLNGCPIVPNIFWPQSRAPLGNTGPPAVVVARVVSGQFDPLNRGFGTANTNVVLLGGRLFAMCESDLPYELGITEDGDVVTLGRHDFCNEDDVPFQRMTAHPKVDQETGDVFTFGYDTKRPFLSFYRIESGRKKRKGVPIGSARGCTLAHDFALTGSHAILPETQIAVNLWWVLEGRAPVGVVPEKVPRLGIIGKYAEDERDMVWVDAPAFNPLHFVNAWEEEGGGTIVTVATNMTRVEHYLDDIKSAGLRLEKVTVDVKGSRVTRRTLSPRFLELPVINPAYESKKKRYVYAAEIGPSAVVGIVKLDLSLVDDEGREDCTVASRLYGPGCYGGEPYVVAREPNNT